jgi:hypothetical protein|tara:strand:- start:6365 stop:6970 length:606 start_codon:yes stop_codon:yes gene_type:complete
MEKISANEAIARGGFGAPVPGQSLTNSPSQKYPWEQAPEYTNVTEAQLYLFQKLTEKEVYLSVTDAISEGIPIDILTRTILYDGYSRGLWDADLMLLLIEPTAVILMALAERTGLDYVIQDGDQDEYDEEDVEAQKKGFDKMKNVASTVRGSITNKVKSVDKNSAALASQVQKGLDAIPQEIVDAAQENIKAKSLLEKDNG